MTPDVSNAENSPDDFLIDIRDLEIRLGGDGLRFVVHVPKLCIRKSDRIAIVGESGSGKSTLLDTLSLVRMATRAAVFNVHFSSTAVDVRPGDDARESKLINRLRRDYIGYVPQIGGLVSALTVWDNITMPMRLRRKFDEEFARDIAQRLGIETQLKKYPENLSVGQRQRVAIARSMCGSPTLIAADEPTAALDPINARGAIESLINCAALSDAAVLIVSHHADELTSRGFRVLEQSIEVRQGGAEIHSTFGMV